MPLGLFRTCLRRRLDEQRPGKAGPRFLSYNLNNKSCCAHGRPPNPEPPPLWPRAPGASAALTFSKHRPDTAVPCRDLAAAPQRPDSNAPLVALTSPWAPDSSSSSQRLQRDAEDRVLVPTSAGADSMASFTLKSQRQEPEAWTCLGSGRGRTRSPWLAATSEDTVTRGRGHTGMGTTAHFCHSLWPWTTHMTLTSSSKSQLTASSSGPRLSCNTMPHQGPAVPPTAQRPVSPRRVWSAPASTSGTLLGPSPPWPHLKLCWAKEPYLCRFAVRWGR